MNNNCSYDLFLFLPFLCIISFNFKKILNLNPKHFFTFDEKITTKNKSQTVIWFKLLGVECPLVQQKCE